MSKDGGCLTGEPKRLHQWFMNGGEAELYPNKKQAVEVPISNSLAGNPPSALSPWGNISGFHSVPSQLTERSFDNESTRTINFDGRNNPSINPGNLSIGRKVIGDPFGNSSLFGLSISHSPEDPKSGINYGGIRKVKVSEVRDSDNIMPMSVGPSYMRDDNSVISTVHGYSKVNECGISMGVTYGREEDNVIAIGDSYGREDDNFMAVGHNYKADNNRISLTNSLKKPDDNILSIFSKGDNNVTAMGTLGNGDDNMISMSQSYKSGASSISMNNKRDTTLIAQLNNKGESDRLSRGHSLDKGGSNVISFGGYSGDNSGNSSGRLVSGYNLGSHPLNQNDFVGSDANAPKSTAQFLASGVEIASKKKDDQKPTKKTPPNNFPSNVRSLLSTGILDEIPVKYIAWSREELRGVIKGSGYLCGCQSCNFSKVVNAYEFERHAGCKTKHPNNHIYFENGKTIYGIVQELRSTPQNMLFDVIQTITGSPINQKSFRLWKESFLAATRELQRIYGKEERNQSF